MEYFSNRISSLRKVKGVTAQGMSLSLALSKGYINRIEQKQILPSMFTFLKICEFFDITPKDFFDDEVDNPQALNKLIEDLKTLTPQELESVISILARGLGRLSLLARTR